MGALGAMRWPGVLRALVLLAFVARALVPPGFMLASADAQVKVVVCSAHGTIEVYYDPDTGAFSNEKAAAKKPSGGEPRCAFAAFAQFVPPTTSLDVLVDTTAAPAQTMPAFVIPGRGLSAPPPPQTGPPTLNA